MTFTHHSLSQHSKLTIDCTYQGPIDDSTRGILVYYNLYLIDVVLAIIPIGHKTLCMFIAEIWEHDDISIKRYDWARTLVLSCPVYLDSEMLTNKVSSL